MILVSLLPPLIGKVCTDCRHDVPLSGFSTNRKRKDGLANICRPCMNTRGRARYRANPGATRERSKRFLAANPGKVAEYSRRSYKKHREKRIAQTKDWQRRHPEQTVSNRRAHYAPNREVYLAHNRRLRKERRHLYMPALRAGWLRRKARIRGATLHRFTGARLLARIEAQGGMCVYCGAEAATVDHVKPIAEGGPHCLSNLRPACGSCNSSKRANPPLPWMLEHRRATEPMPLP